MLFFLTKMYKYGIFIKRDNMKKIFGAIIKYLSDWKNWLVHALVGIVLLVMVIWVPIMWWIKLIIILCVITFNVLRMKFDKKRKENKSKEENNLS